MTSQGSAIVRFQRALKTGNPGIVLAAAHELPKPVQLRDALAILLVLLDRDPDRYPAGPPGSQRGSSANGDCLSLRPS
jgi:hypothetical protein